MIVCKLIFRMKDVCCVNIHPPFYKKNYTGNNYFNRDEPSFVSCRVVR